MEFFGLTIYGASDPIKFLMRPDFQEPANPPDLTEVIEKGKYTRPFHEVIRHVDIYEGNLDGYSYRSNDILCTTRKKDFRKPIGPNDMYRDKISESMQYGWWLYDPALKGQTWFKPNYFIPKVWSDRTRFLNETLLIDSSYQL